MTLRIGIAPMNSRRDGIFLVLNFFSILNKLNIKSILNGNIHPGLDINILQAYTEQYER